MANVAKKIKIWQVWLKVNKKEAVSVLVPAKTEKEAKEYCNGNGEVLAVMDYNEEAKDKVKKAMQILFESEEHREAYDILQRLYYATTGEEIA